MHVVIVCRGLGGTGSVALVAQRQARELARHGRVTLVSDSAPAGLEVSLVKAPNLHLLRRFRHAPDEVFFARAVRQRLFELHARDPIDFVLCQGHVPAVLSAKPFRARSGVKFGIVVHGDIAERAKGTYDRRLTALYAWATPRAYHAADLTLTLSKFFASLARNRGAPESSVVVVPNGIDVRDLGLEEPVSPVRRHDGPLRIFFAGRLAVEKGVGHLIDAMDAIAGAGDATLTIAGAGPLDAQLRTRATDRIRFAGVIPRRELGALYRAHDVACLPSVSETFPLSALEALACGLPLIATTAGGLPEIVQHDVNGLLVPPSDSRALGAAIARISADAALHARLAANAHESVLPRLSWPAIGDRIAAEIQSRL